MNRVHIPAKRRRFVFIHRHIMKNAGTTVASVLSREFGSGFCDMDSEDHDGEITADELVEYLLENPSIRALSSHQIRFPRIEHSHLIAFECCIIRHPIDRLDSLYRYLRGGDSSLSIAKIARQSDLPGFLCHLRDHQPHLLCNVQTMMLANGGRFTRPPDKYDLDIACNVISKISLPGLVNRLDESMVAAEYFLHPAFPGLQLHSTPENVSRPISTLLDERIRQIREACGDALYNQIYKMQQLDLELFRFTAQEIDRRADLVPDFHTKLHAFRARTQLRYATAAA